MPIFAGQNREQMRRMYLEAWRKFSARAPLEPLEAQLAAVITEHPEYVTWVESGEHALGADFTPEGGRENPFLHMGLHLAIREQVATDRPLGITEIHESSALASAAPTPQSTLCWSPSPRRSGKLSTPARCPTSGFTSSDCANYRDARSEQRQTRVGAHATCAAAHRMTPRRGSATYSLAASSATAASAASKPSSDLARIAASSSLRHSCAMRPLSSNAARSA